MAKKLDRSRGYGEVWGHDGGAAFVQDEILFDADGNALAVDDQAPEAEPVAPKKRGPKKAEPVAVDDQVAANLQGVTGESV